MYVQGQVNVTNMNKKEIAKKMPKQDYAKIIDKQMGSPMKQLDKLMSKTFTHVRCGKCNRFGHHHDKCKN